MSVGYRMKFLQAARLHFDKQKAEVLASLPSIATDKSVKRGMGLFDIDGNVKELIALFAPIYDDQVREAGQEAMLLIGLAGFDYENPLVTQFITSRNARVSKGIDTETDKQLRAELSAGLAEGETLAELAARVEKVYGAAAGFRADRIARTETIRANNWASEEAWSQSELVEAKEWFTAKDERVCPFCGPMNGKTVALGGRYFSKGDEYEGSDGSTMKIDYEHIEQPPLHANCRCVLLPVLRQD